MNTEQAIPKIEWFKNMAIKMNLGDRALESLDMALSALRAQAERDNPQPLTLEELKERVGKPVYTVLIDEPGEYIPNNEWWDVLVEIRGDMALFRSGHMRSIDTLGKTWLAYDAEVKSNAHFER